MLSKSKLKLIGSVISSEILILSTFGSSIETSLFAEVLSALFKSFIPIIGVSLLKTSDCSILFIDSFLESRSKLIGPVISPLSFTKLLFNGFDSPVLGSIFSCFVFILSKSKLKLIGSVISSFISVETGFIVSSFTG